MGSREWGVGSEEWEVGSGDMRNTFRRNLQEPLQGRALRRYEVIARP